MIRSRSRRRRQGKVAKQGDLLRLWLDLLDHVDNPLRRRAAKFRQTHRARRVLPDRRPVYPVIDLAARKLVPIANP